VVYDIHGQGYWGPGWFVRSFAVVMQLWVWEHAGAGGEWNRTEVSCGVGEVYEVVDTVQEDRVIVGVL